MTQFITAFFSGSSHGAIYALVSMGLVLVWRGAGVVNFAQMGQAMFTTYIASQMIMHKNSYWIAFVTALLAGAILGSIIDFGLMRPLSARKNSALLASESMRTTIPVIASLGVLGILKALAGIIWAGEERGFPSPVSTNGIKFGTTTLAFTAFDLFVIGIVLITLLLTTIFFTKTGMGLAMRASALNPEVTRLSGVRIKSVRTLSWAISGMASSLAGLLITPSTNLSPNTLDLLLIVGFTAAVIGGLTSLVGAVVGGFAIGYVISFVNVYSSPENVFLAILIFLMLMLFLRPQGIFGAKEVRRV
ncbi:MAG: branched-chain amino acid ABC transporter permease [Actinomycetes bacterium]